MYANAHKEKVRFRRAGFIDRFRTEHRIFAYAKLGIQRFAAQCLNGYDLTEMKEEMVSRHHKRCFQLEG